MGGCVTTNFLCSCWGRNSQGLSCGSTTYLCCGGGMTHKCVSYIWTTRCKDIRITRNKNEMGTLEGIQRKVWHSVSVLLHSSFRLLRHFFKKGVDDSLSSLLIPFISASSTCVIYSHGSRQHKGPSIWNVNRSTSQPRSERACVRITWQGTCSSFITGLGGLIVHQMMLSIKRFYH